MFNRFNFIHITGGQLAEDIAKFIPNGPIELYHDNTKRFSTSGIGATVFGQLDTTSNVAVGSGITLSPDGDVFAVGVSTFNGLVKLPDSSDNQTGRLMFGDGTDLQIFHTGSAGEIGNFTGNLNVKSNSFRIFNGAANQIQLRTDQNDSVILYHSGNEKFKTTNTGAVVTGILTATSNVNVGSGITLSPDGDIFATGISTLGNSSSSKVIIGNPVNLPTLAASTKIVAADMAGNDYYVDISILGGRTGRSMLKFGDQDSKESGSIQYHHSDDSLRFYNNGNIF